MSDLINYSDRIFAESDEILLINEYYPVDEDSYFSIRLKGSMDEVGKIIFSTKLNNIYGNVSYEILPNYRGYKYAQKALKLLAENIYNLSDEDLYIAILPDNKASIKTAINAGATLVNKVQIPKKYNFSIDEKYKYVNMYIIKNNRSKTK